MRRSLLGMGVESALGKVVNPRRHSARDQPRNHGKVLAKPRAGVGDRVFRLGGSLSNLLLADLGIHFGSLQKI